MTDPKAITEEEWRRIRADQKFALPAALSDAQDLPSILLRYQRELLQSTAMHQVTISEKSRRIGMTWGIGADAVLTAATTKSDGGMDVLYIGYNLDMAREFIDTCAMWARAFSPAASEVSEFMFQDQDENGHEKEIQAFRIRFASGFEIVALTSKPRSLRGRQGYVIIDEAAFHDDLEELLKAALALLIWGGKILVISTHDGADNPFNQLIQEVKEGRKPYNLVVTTFDDALKDGLYERICMVTGKEWSLEAEGKFRSDIRSFYGDGVSEELDCIPKAGGGAYLTRTLLERRMIDGVPILRVAWADEDTYAAEHIRQAEMHEWCERHLKPLLNGLNPNFKSYLGGDFARSGDLSVYWPVQEDQDLVSKPPFLIEARNIPYEQQKQLLFYVLKRLPRFMGAALDATGNGGYLAEVAAQEFGTTRIFEVKLNEGWYGEYMPKYKAAIEDGNFLLPHNADILADHRGIKIVNRVPLVPRNFKEKGSDGMMRHGDSAIAGALAHFVTRQDTVCFDDIDPMKAGRVSNGAYSAGGQDLKIDDNRGWGVVAGGQDYEGFL